MSNVKLQWVTQWAEYQIAYIARGSNPANQDNPEFEKLFRYCLKHEHWSPFQMASMCLQFETSLAIAAQVKRHWSLAICEPADIQETSMRYMDPFEHEWGFQEVELRQQAKSNRQSSEKVMKDYPDSLPHRIIDSVFNEIRNAREVLKEAGVANEIIRMLYPQATTTRFFISGSCRSWIHYFEQRLSEHAQLEHQILALQAWEIFEECFPTIAKILLLKGNSSVEAQTRIFNERFTKREEN